MLSEVRQAPCECDPEPGGRCRVPRFEVGERVLQRSARAVEVVRRHSGGDDGVVERRHEHFGAVVGDHLDAVEQVLLGRQRRGGRGPRGRPAVPLDERVDPGRACDRARSPGERLTARQPHQVVGRTSTSPFSMRFMLATT